MSIEFPYLVGMVLIEESGKRAMPLGGKSIKEPLEASKSPEIKGEKIALELLVRVLQRSENSHIKRIASENSVLLIQISMENMQKELPRLKADWLKDGNNAKLLDQLRSLTLGIWSVGFSKESGIVYKSLS